MKGALRTPLLFAPGTKYHYQSMGIMLAAEIVERVAKTSLPKFLAEHVFTPLGMSRTVLGLGRFPKADMVPMKPSTPRPKPVAVIRMRRPGTGTATTGATSPPRGVVRTAPWAT